MDTKKTKMRHKEDISHVGIVSRILGNSVEITLQGKIHCEACHAKSACGVSETESKIVKVSRIDDSYSLNQLVTVNMQNSLGLKAVFYGYVLPFILLFTVLFGSSLFLKEWQAGLFALFVLIPYYWILYINEKKLEKVFKISIFK